MIRFALILAALLLVSACADDVNRRNYDYDLSALEPWQQEIFVQKAEKWNFIVGYQMFSFGGSTNRVYFGYYPGRVMWTESNGNIGIDKFAQLQPCPSNVPFTFDDSVDHELGHVIGLGHSDDPRDIMHDPPPVCLY